MDMSAVTATALYPAPLPQDVTHSHNAAQTLIATATQSQKVVLSVLISQILLVVNNALLVRTAHQAKLVQRTLAVDMGFVIRSTRVAIPAIRNVCSSRDLRLWRILGCLQSIRKLLGISRIRG